MSPTQSRVGRPRSREASEAIQRATLELLCEEGLGQTRIDAVAERAGVSRPTIYRRYADRDALLEAAVIACFEEDVPSVPETDDPLADVHALLDNTVEMLERTPIGPVFRAMIPHLPRNPRLGKVANELGRRRRVRLSRALERAIEAGQIEPPRSLDAVIDGLIGAIYFRSFITGRRLDRRYVRELFAGLVRGR